MNKKGFTLVELLAVIVLIAIIASITTVIIKNVLKDSKNELTDLQKKYIEDAAEQYYIREGMSKNVNCVNVSELLEKDYFNSVEIKNPKNEDNMTGSVKIVENANQYSYEYQDSLCE